MSWDRGIFPQRFSSAWQSTTRRRPIINWACRISGAFLSNIRKTPNKDRMGHRCIGQEKRFLTQWINRRCKTAFPGRKESDRKSSAYSWGLFSYHTKTASCRCLPVSCSNILRGNVPKAIVIGGLQAEKCWRRTELS